MTISLARRPPVRLQRQSADAQACTAGHWTRTLIDGKTRMAYVPNPLPSVPVTSGDGTLQTLRDTASMAMGQLHGLVGALGETHALVRHALRREAVASARIEGHDTSIVDILLFEVDDSPGGSAARSAGAATAASTLSALELGLTRQRAGEALGQRLLADLHLELMRHAKRRRQQAGRFRRDTIAVGADGGPGTFVPPPPAYIGPCINELERYSGDADVPWLTRAVLSFAQLLCIVPFNGANGRLARIVLSLLLDEQPSVATPSTAAGLAALAPSVVLLRNWDEAERHLTGVRDNGDFEAWMAFVFAQLAEAARVSANCIEDARTLFARDRERIEWLGRSAGSALRLHALLLEHPVISIPDAARQLDLTQPTVGKSVEHLRSLGMLREMTGRERRRLFAYEAFVDLLEPTRA